MRGTEQSVALDGVAQHRGKDQVPGEYRWDTIYTCGTWTDGEETWPVYRLQPLDPADFPESLFWRSATIGFSLTRERVYVSWRAYH